MIGFRMVHLLDAEGAEAILVLGIRGDGVFRLAMDQRIRGFLQDDRFRGELVKALKDGLEKMGTCPLDDLDLR